MKKILLMILLIVGCGDMDGGSLSYDSGGFGGVLSPSEIDVTYLDIDYNVQAKFINSSGIMVIDYNIINIDTILFWPIFSLNMYIYSDSTFENYCFTHEQFVILDNGFYPGEIVNLRMRRSGVNGVCNFSTQNFAIKNIIVYHLN